MQGYAYANGKLCAEAELMAQISKVKQFKNKQMNQPLAYVHPGAKIAKNVVIEPFTTINNNKIVKLPDSRNRLIEMIEKL